MAPRNKYTKEEMVDAALRVVRKNGIDSLSAKTLAKELGISTQPVFTCFHTMDAVREEVRTAAERVYDDYVSEGLGQEIPFHGFGMQYIRFAKEEPELYRLLFLTKMDDTFDTMDSMKHSQARVRPYLEQTYHISAVEADRYFRDLWLVAHSIATLIVTGGCPYSEQEIGKIFTGFSVSLCKALKEIPGFAENSFDRDAIFRELAKK